MPPSCPSPWDTPGCPMGQGAPRSPSHGHGTTIFPIPGLGEPLSLLHPLSSGHLARHRDPSALPVPPSQGSRQPLPALTANSLSGSFGPFLKGRE